MMFSVPAIFILGYGDQFNPVIMTFGCIAGAFLGIAFIIPLRKHMIDFERLTYPGGVAVATILKSPGAGVQKALILLSAAAFSALVHLLSKWTGVENWDLGEAKRDKLDGHWFLRDIYQGSKLNAVELVYCPIVPGEPVVCRSSVVWERDGRALVDHPKIGRPAGAPPP
jgi:hypothetical protein